MPKLNFNWNSVGFKLFIIYLGSMFVAVPIVGFLSYYKSKEIIESKIGAYALDSVKQANVRLQMLLKDYENRSALIFSFKDLQKEIKNQFDDNYERLQNMEYISKFFSDFINSQNDTVNVYILGEYGSSIRYSTVSSTLSMPIDNVYRNEVWYSQIREANGALVWFGNQRPFIARGGDDVPVFAFGRALKDLTGSTDIIGVVLYEVNAAEVRQILGDINAYSMGQSFIVDADNVIIADSDGSRFMHSFNVALPGGYTGMKSVVLDGDEKLVVYDSIGSTGFKLVKLASINELVKDSKQIGYFTFYLIAAFVALATMMAFAVVRQMNKPIYQLLQWMGKVKEGDFKSQITHKRKDEFGTLFENFNLMVARIKSLIDELYIQQLLKKEIQLKMMASQINAHFLYNTLDSIHWIARVYKIDEISKMIFGLSKYLRLSLNQGRDIVEVAEVIELIDSYLSIQKVRYQDKFEARIEAQTDVHRCKVLKHIFQPLVENAIYHGIEEKKGTGNLTIVWEKQEEMLVFQVKDDGVGIEKEKLLEIRKVLGSEELLSDENFALKNIHSQIKLAYGEQYGLEIDSEQYVGTSVTVTVPIRT